MRVKTLLATVLAILTLVTAAAQAQNAARDTGSAVTVMEMQDLLDYHNKLRTDVGVNPVTWSPAIANVAQAWADHIARTGEIAHSQPRKYGENLWAGSGGGYDVMSAARQWAAESQSYTKGTPIPKAEDFDSFPAKHYTQMVWKDTTEIGVGKAIIQTGDMKGWVIIVGNYGPPGNSFGELPY